MIDPESAPFTGFPDRAVAAVIPAAFFTELIPIIDTDAELTVTLHLLWRTARGTAPPYVPVRLLLEDRTLMAGLRLRHPDGVRALIDGLSRATRRGTVIATRTIVEGREEDVVAPNTARGRRALHEVPAVAARFLENPPPPAEDAPGVEEEILALYERNIGLLQPILVEELRQAAAEFPAEWIREAFAEAMAYNRRNWRYVKRILERWAANGRYADTSPGKRTRKDPDSSTRGWTQTYRPGERLPDL
ncbi:MAG: DnaD domain protein [Chloroflexota bacterium]|nr:MAG: DnaD domain protein [Chloroflexota bacterium]